MRISRYNIRFYEFKVKPVEKIAAAKFSTKKQPSSSFTDDKEEAESSFADIYKETIQAKDGQKVKKK